MTTLEIEIILLRDLNFRQNIIVPNVQFGIVRYWIEGGKRVFDELHECDILKVTPAGYATEYEIKISKSDFKADLKKKHKHDSRFIKQMYYVVPFELLDFAKENIPCDCGLAYISDRGKLKYCIDAPLRKDYFKWTQDEMFKLAKLGTMRIYNLKKKLLK